MINGMSDDETKAKLSELVELSAPREKTLSIRVTRQEFEDLLLLAKFSAPKRYGKKITYNNYVYNIVRMFLKSEGVAKELQSLKNRLKRVES